MLCLSMNFQKLLDENPQSDFFRVWTSCMFVDKDLWKLKLVLPNKTVIKCYICEWIYKSCLIKIHKVTSLEYEPVLCLLKKIWHMIWLIIWRRNSFCVRYVTQLWGWLSDTCFWKFIWEETVCNSVPRMNIDVFTFLALIRQSREETVSLWHMYMFKILFRFWMESKMLHYTSYITALTNVYKF